MAGYRIGSNYNACPSRMFTLVDTGSQLVQTEEHSFVLTGMHGADFFTSPQGDELLFFSSHHDGTFGTTSAMYLYNNATGAWGQQQTYPGHGGQRMRAFIDTHDLAGPQMYVLPAPYRSGIDNTIDTAGWLYRWDSGTRMLVQHHLMPPAGSIGGIVVTEYAGVQFGMYMSYNVGTSTAVRSSSVGTGTPGTVHQGGSTMMVWNSAIRGFRRTAASFDFEIPTRGAIDSEFLVDAVGGDLFWIVAELRSGTVTVTVDTSVFRCDREEP